MAQASRPLYLRVGMLVVVGLVLAIGFILFLTSGSLRGEQRIFETYIRESVAGLDVGAPVRYRGVQVGRVIDVRATPAGADATISLDFTTSSVSVSSSASFRSVNPRFSIRPSRRPWRWRMAVSGADTASRSQRNRGQSGN